MFLAAFVTFIAFLLLLTHLPSYWVRRLVGYKGWVDLTLHGTILWMFIGTSTMGLLQAEAAGICFSLYLRFYYWSAGYERWAQLPDRPNKCWVRYAGKFT